MDAAWKRWLALAVLWGSPVIITFVVVGVCWWLQTVRANFGAMRSTAGLMVLMAAGVLVLHSGYFLAPLVEGRGVGGEIWSLVLMAPGLLGGLSLGVFLMATGVGPELAEKVGGAAGLGVAVVVGLVVYLGPAVVLLAE